MKQFLNYLLGPLDAPLFFALFLLALLGMAVGLLVHSTNRTPDKGASPVNFDVPYLVRDNRQRTLLSIVLIVVTLRFFKELTSYEINPFHAFLIGMGYDKLGELLRNKNIIDKSK